MVRYYDKRTEKVINIPELSKEMLIKKTFLLPVELNKISIQDTEKTTEVAGYEVLNDKVIWTVIDIFHIDTLEEVTDKKVEALKNYVKPKFPKDYKQRSAALGIYSQEENTRIQLEVHKWYEYIEKFEAQLLACETIKDLELVDYMTAEDKLAQEEMMKEMLI